MNVFITGGGGVHRIAPRRAPARARRPRGRSRRPLDRRMENIAHLDRAAGLRAPHRLGARRAAGQRAGRSLRCHRASRRRGRREADRRAAGAHHRDQRPRHRGRARAPRPRSRSWSSSRRRPRSTASRTRSRSARITISSSARRRTRAGPMPAPRRSTSGWRSPTAHEKDVPVIIARFFNTVGPRQTGRYGMVLPNFARRRCAASRSRCTAPATNPLLRPRARRGRGDAAADRDAGGAWARSSTSARPRKSRSVELAELVRDAAGSTSEIVLVPYAEAYAEGFEDMLRRVPDVSKLERDDRLPAEDAARRDHRRRRRGPARRARRRPATAGAHRSSSVMRAILTYHSIDASGLADLGRSADAFRAHVRLLASGRVQVVPLDDARGPSADGGTRSRSPSMMAFVNFGKLAAPLLRTRTAGHGVRGDRPRRRTQRLGRCATARIPTLPCWLGCARRAAERGREDRRAHAAPSAPDGAHVATELADEDRRLRRADRSRAWTHVPSSLRVSVRRRQRRRGGRRSPRSVRVACTTELRRVRPSERSARSFRVSTCTISANAGSSRRGGRAAFRAGCGSARRARRARQLQTARRARSRDHAA